MRARSHVCPHGKMTATFNSLGDAGNEPGKSFLFFLRDDDPGVDSIEERVKVVGCRNAIGGFRERAAVPIP